MLFATERTESAPGDFLRAGTEVFAVFDTQDSGNVSYGVLVGQERFFVKTAGSPKDTKPLLPFAERVALLRNAILVAGAVSHDATPKLRHVIESTEGPLLVYDWAEGELVGTKRARRADPASSYA